jgi:hypothetical protein
MYRETDLFLYWAVSSGCRKKVEAAKLPLLRVRTRKPKEAASKEVVRGARRPATTVVSLVTLLANAQIHAWKEKIGMSSGRPKRRIVAVSTAERWATSQLTVPSQLETKRATIVDRKDTLHATVPNRVNRLKKKSSRGVLLSVCMLFCTRGI